jgi:hypothetical protein
LLELELPPELRRKIEVIFGRVGGIGTDFAAAIALAQVLAAIRGDTSAAVEIANRVEGRVPQPAPSPESGLVADPEAIAQAVRRLRSLRREEAEAAAEAQQPGRDPIGPPEPAEAEGGAAESRPTPQGKEQHDPPQADPLQNGATKS